MAVKTGNPETDQMFVELSKAVRESFEISNDLLPPHYRNNVSKHTSLQFLHTRTRKLNPGPSQHELDKAERARRVEIMTDKYSWEQMKADGEENFEFDLTISPNEYKLYQKQLEFCAAAVRAGTMNFDETED